MDRKSRRTASFRRAGGVALPQGKTGSNSRCRWGCKTSRGWHLKPFQYQPTPQSSAATAVVESTTSTATQPLPLDLDLRAVMTLLESCHKQKGRAAWDARPFGCPAGVLKNRPGTSAISHRRATACKRVSERCRAYRHHPELCSSVGHILGPVIMVVAVGMHTSDGGLPESRRPLAKGLVQMPEA